MRGAFWAFAGAAVFAAGAATETLGYWLLLPVGIVLLGVAVSAVWRSQIPADVSPVTPNWALIAAPTVLATPAVDLRIGAVAAVLWAGAAFWPTQPRLRLAWPCMVLPVVSLVIVLRPNGDDYVPAVFFVVAAITLARAVTISASKASALVSLIDGVGLFAVASVALWLAGVTGDPTRTGGITGGNTLTGGTRVIFPLSNSLAASGSIAAVYLVAVIPVLMMYRQYRLRRLVAVVCAAAVCVLSDSRSAIIIALVLCTCVLLVPKLFQRAAPWLVGVSLIVPFIYGHIQGVAVWAADALSSSAPWLTRRSLLEGREFIWSESITHYVHRADWFHQMVGYGFRGQAASGASAYYSDRSFFENFGVDARFKSPHNSTLQVLFDGGWITTAVFVLMIVWTGFVLAHGRRVSLAGLSMLTALTLASVPEGVLSPGHMQPTWWALVTLVMVVFSSPCSKSSPNPRIRRNTRIEVSGVRRPLAHNASR